MRVSPLGPRVDSGRPFAAAGGFALLAAFGVALAYGLYVQPLPLALVLVAGFGLIGMTALALFRYDLAVALGIGLLAVVRFEPAPVDAAFAVIIATAAVTGRLRPNHIPVSMAGLCGAFIALNVLAMMDTIVPSRSLKFISITVYLLAFALWLSDYVDRRSRARMIVRVYVAVAILSSIVASAAALLHFPGAEFLTTSDGGRAQGLFKDPNVYGPFLVPAALILLEEALRPNLLGPGRWLKRIGFMILAMGVVFSYSRAAWLNLVVGIVVMLCVLAVRRGSARSALSLFVIVVTGVTVAGAAVVVTGSLEFLHERAKFQTYDNQRFGAQHLGIEFAQSHPLGIGPGQFEIYSPVSAHSTYIRALAEEGILGAAVLIALLVGVLLMAVRNAINGRSAYGIGSTALLASWCGAMANSVFVDTLHWRHLWLVAGLIWAASMAPGGVDQASSAAAGRGEPR